MSDLAEFAAWMRHRNLAEATIDRYVRIIGRLDVELERDAIERWSIESGGGVSAITLRLAAIRSYARFRRIPDPTDGIDRPRRPRSLPRPVGREWLAMFDDADPRVRAIAIVFAETGLRLSELCSVDVGTPPPDELRIVGKGRRVRMVPLTDTAREALGELRGRVPWAPRTVELKLKEVGDRYGRRITPHMLRHQFGTDLADAEVDLGDIQKLMGHASPATTMGYAAWSTSRVRRAIERRVAYQREEVA